MPAEVVGGSVAHDDCGQDRRRYSTDTVTQAIACPARAGSRPAGEGIGRLPTVDDDG